MNRYPAIRKTAMRSGALVAAALSMIPLGCTHAELGAIETFLATDADYLKLRRGAERVDAIWAYAVERTGSQRGALDMLGEISLGEGMQLRHTFNTGLSPGGVLARNDKTDHFFVSAMWQYHDQRRLIPVAGVNGVAWEIVGEVRSWIKGGRGYDLRDEWANRLGREFGRRLSAHHKGDGPPVVPGDIIAEAEQYRPPQVTGGLQHPVPGCGRP